MTALLNGYDCNWANRKTCLVFFVLSITALLVSGTQILLPLRVICACICTCKILHPMIMHCKVDAISWEFSLHDITVYMLSYQYK